MNALELQAIRHIFAMTVEESARYIARDNNVAAWQQWEKGEREIPEDIIRICSEMKARRKLRINAIIDKINNRIGNNTMRFFPRSERFSGGLSPRWFSRLENLSVGCC